MVTVAKISLSDVEQQARLRDDRHRLRLQRRDHRRVYVLAGKAAIWDTLDCDAMNAAAGSMDTMGNGFCRMYADLTDAEKATVRGLDYTGGGAEAAALRRHH